MVQCKTKLTSIGRLLKPFVVTHLSLFFVVPLVVSHCSHLSDRMCFISLHISNICLKQKTFWRTLHTIHNKESPFKACIPAFYPFPSILDHHQCFRAFNRLWPSSARTTRVRSCSAASCPSTSSLSSRTDGWAWVFSCSADAALLMVKLMKASELQRNWAGSSLSFWSVWVRRSLERLVRGFSFCWHSQEESRLQLQQLQCYEAVTVRRYSHITLSTVVYDFESFNVYSDLGETSCS